VDTNWFSLWSEATWWTLTGIRCDLRFRISFSFLPSSWCYKINEAVMLGDLW